LDSNYRKFDGKRIQAMPLFRLLDGALTVRSIAVQVAFQNAIIGMEVGMGVLADPDLRITIDGGQRSGQPCIRGFRITVWDVLDMLASGMTEDGILADYPYLESADFKAVYAYASHCV
jgi:uncharacterized protein (DUF433 family)